MSFVSCGVHPKGTVAGPLQFSVATVTALARYNRTELCQQHKDIFYLLSHEKIMKEHLNS